VGGWGAHIWGGGGETLRDDEGGLQFLLVSGCEGVKKFSSLGVAFEGRQACIPLTARSAISFCERAARKVSGGGGRLVKQHRRGIQGPTAAPSKSTLPPR